MNVELSVEQAVKIDAGGITLHGDLSVPERAQGLVLFAHGSGSSRHSRRNRAVAAALVSQRLAWATLEKRGYRVRVVANGRAAIAAWEQEPFDVILMDVQMPEMDGLEATAAIRQREQGTGRRIPIVALTAHVMTGEIDRCLAAGMDACLTKPFDPDSLCATIAEFTSESAAVK